MSSSAVRRWRASFEFLQVYEQTSQGGSFPLGRFIWFMMPYLLCLAVWAKGPPYTAATAAVTVALAADSFAYYSAYTGRDGRSRAG